MKKEHVVGIYQRAHKRGYHYLHHLLLSLWVVRNIVLRAISSFKCFSTVGHNDLIYSIFLILDEMQCNQLACFANTV